jgi:predicted amidohydrolase YtcJ
MTASLEDFAAYQDLAAEGALTVRITLYPSIDTLERWTNVRVRRGFGGPMLKVNGLKGFADGSLGSSTAYFFDSYLDSPGNYGLTLRPLAAGGEMEQLVRATARAGLQPAIHAIGDRAIRELLDIFERLPVDEGAATPGSSAARCRIEHAQHIHPADIGRFGPLGVIASMQPYHAADDGRWAEKRIGRERCETTYAFRTLLDQRATVAFGSDWPVAPLSPLLGIDAAVTRRTLDGLHPEGWIPAQKISVEEALTAYSRGSATAAFDEHHLGTLRAGYLADFVVLSEDILRIDPERIREVKVEMTVVGGKVVYSRG